MAFLEMKVSSAAGASDQNGGGPFDRMGANDGPIIKLTNVTGASIGAPGITLTNNAGTGWGATAVGDVVSWDPTGSAEFLRVVELSYQGNAQVIRCSVLTPSFSGNANRTAIVGGAWRTLTKVATVLTINFQDANGNPPRANIIADTAQAGVSFATHSGSELLPITIQGCTNQPGDGGLPTINTNISVTNNVSYLNFADLNITGGTSPAFRSAGGSTIRGTRLIGNTTGTGGAFDLGPAHMMQNCIASGSGHGFELQTADDTMLIGCIARQCNLNGFYGLSVNARFVGCLADRCGASGFNIFFGGTLLNCTSVGSTNGSGFTGTASALGPNYAINCVFANNAQYGLESTASGILQSLHNAFYGNASGPYGNIPEWNREGDLTLTTDPFVDSGNGDLRIDRNKVGGAQLIGAGFPLSIDGLAAEIDIGALQAAQMWNRRDFLRGHLL